jgi:arginine deiminase
MTDMPINVFSEIGKLKKVLLHRPGKELENLMPEYLDRLLFDDIPYLKIAQEEHDAFAQIFRDKGVEVVYLEDLAAESLINDEVKSKFIDEYIEEAGIKENRETGILKEYFLSFSDNKAMVLKMMEGIRKSEIKDYKGMGLAEFLSDQYPFIIDPVSLSACTFILPSGVISTFAPKASNPFICWSIGLSPMSQPPGIKVDALLNLPRPAPRT